MGKILEEIKKQMSHEILREDANEVLKIYNALIRIDEGHIWSSKWMVLVRTAYRRIDGKMIKFFKPTEIGNIFIKGLNY